MDQLRRFKCISQGHLFIFNLFVVDKFYFNLQLDLPCLKPLAQSTILPNVGIVDTRHLRQHLSL